MMTDRSDLQLIVLLRRCRIPTNLPLCYRSSSCTTVVLLVRLFPGTISFPVQVASDRLQLN